MANIQIRRRGGPDSDPLWQLRVRVQGKDCYRHMHGTRGAAEAAAAAFAEELDGRAPDFTPSMPFRAWTETWIARHLPGLAGQTAGSYRGILDKHLLPALGDKRLSRITTADGLRLQQRLTRARFAASSIAQTLRLGRQILADAARLGVIATNPWAELRQAHPRRRHRPEILDPTRFGELAAGPPDDLQEILRLALGSGLRVGELLALRWRDVAAGFETLAVTGSLETVLGAVARKAPKNEAGYRRVSLPAEVAAMLRARCLRLGRPDGERPVFAAAAGGWLRPNTVIAAARKRLRRDGIAASIHGLRHAHATALLSAGIAPQTVANRLGHSDVRTTLSVYGHVLPGDDPRVVAVLNKAYAA